MNYSRYTIGVFALLILGCVGPIGDTGNRDPQCGSSTGSAFELQLEVLVHPVDLAGEPWDWDGNVSNFWNDYGELIELLGALASQGTYEAGTMTSVLETYYYPYEDAFAALAAPDPVAEFYSATGQDWGTPETIDWENNQHYVQLTSTALDFGVHSNYAIDFYDEDDLSYWDPVGAIVLDQELARSLAECGPLSATFDEATQNEFQHRFAAISIEITTVR